MLKRIILTPTCLFMYAPLMEEKMILARIIFLLSILLPSCALANSEWVYYEKEYEGDNLSYCQVMSRYGLGIRFYSEDYYIIAILYFDTMFINSMREIVKNGNGRVVLQPDERYANFTTLKHEETTVVSIGELGIQRNLSRFSAVSSDYHLIEAIQDSEYLNVIITDNGGRIVNPIMDDVDLAIPLKGASEAIDWALQCIDR